MANAVMRISRYYRKNVEKKLDIVTTMRKSIGQGGGGIEATSRYCCFGKIMTSLSIPGSGVGFRGKLAVKLVIGKGGGGAEVASPCNRSPSRVSKVYQVPGIIYVLVVNFQVLFRYLSWSS